MQRMSEPQMVDAFMRSSTSPWPGTGTATSLSSTVLLPGRYAPFMFDRSLRILLFDRSIQIPEIFPGLVLFPQKDLPLDEAAILVDTRDGGHVGIGQRRAHHALQVRQVVAWIDGKRDRRGAALLCPLHADHRRVYAEAPCDCDDRRVFDIHRVFGCAVALRAARGADRTVGDEIGR